MRQTLQAAPTCFPARSAARLSVRSPARLLCRLLARCAARLPARLPASLSARPPARLLAALFALAFASGAAPAHDGHAQQQGGRVVLQRQPLPDAPGRDGILLTVTYAPGEASPAHRHPGSVFAYVLEGEVQSQLGDGPLVTYRAGESWVETPRVLHAVSRNASAEKPAKLLVWLMAGDGEAPTVPENK